MRINFIAVLVTCSSKKEAEKIVDALLRQRLIACANIISWIDSKFWWKGKIDKAREVLVILKTKRENFRRIEKEIKRVHSYEVPEIIALSIVEGNRKYLDWLERETCRVL